MVSRCTSRSRSSSSSSESTSRSEAMEMRRYFANCLLEDRPFPSAMLLDTAIAARTSCDASSPRRFPAYGVVFDNPVTTPSVLWAKRMP